MTDGRVSEASIIYTSYKYIIEKVSTVINYHCLDVMFKILCYIFAADWQLLLLDVIGSSYILASENKHL